MAQLTPEQQERLIALLEKLESFPTAELIVYCEEAKGFDPASDADRERLDRAMAGAWAYDRMLLYLDRLRSLNEERMQIGQEIRALPRHHSPKTEQEVEVEASARVNAAHLAGKQEVVINFYSVSIQHILSLLKVAAEAVGYQLPADDDAFLAKFRALRNHFEHWPSRLPGKSGEVGLVTKTVTDDGYRVQGGLQRGNQDRVIVVEPRKPVAVAHIVEANAAGVARVERIVEETAAKIRELALERVRAHYVADPTEIPPPESIRGDLLTRVEGFGP